MLIYDKSGRELCHLILLSFFFVEILTTQESIAKLNPQMVISPQQIIVPVYVKQFNLFLDEYGLLHCKSRVQNADTNAIDNTPIVVPTHCRYAELIIRDNYEKVFHDGIAETLCPGHMKYWIPRLQELVKKNDNVQTI